VEDTALYYRAADIFVCTSKIESFPRVILEAMAYELPIITTPAYGIREQVRPGVNGLFYESGNAAQLAGTISELISDPPLRSRLAGNSKLVLATLTTFEEMIEQYACALREASLIGPVHEVF
jgi:glycosyltransferase involved in cell wall biosynthesis